MRREEAETPHDDDSLDANIGECEAWRVFRPKLSGRSIEVIFQAGRARCWGGGDLVVGIIYRSVKESCSDLSLS